MGYSYDNAVKCTAKFLRKQDSEGMNITGDRLYGIAAIMLGMVSDGGLISTDDAIADIMHEIMTQDNE